MIWQHHHLPVVSSTNRWALEWMRQHVPSGPVLFTTDHQTEGRGQRDRPWSSEAGRDASLSVAFPAESCWKPADINMRAALAVRDALLALMPESTNPRAVLIKWPNDILVWHGGQHRKVAGILVENVWRGEQWSASVIGVGINVASNRLTRSYPAVSLKEAWNVSLVPSEVSRAVAHAMTRELQESETPGFARFQEALFACGEWRTFRVDGNLNRGCFLGVSEEGMGHFEWKDSPQTSPTPNTWLASNQVEWCW